MQGNSISYLKDKAFLDDILAGRFQWLVENLNKLNPPKPYDVEKIRTVVKDFLNNLFMLQKTHPHNVSFQSFMASYQVIDAAMSFFLSHILESFKNDSNKSSMCILLISTALSRQEASLDEFAQASWLSGVEFEEVLRLFALFLSHAESNRNCNLEISSPAY